MIQIIINIIETIIHRIYYIEAIPRKTITLLKNDTITRSNTSCIDNSCSTVDYEKENQTININRINI